MGMNGHFGHDCFATTKCGYSRAMRETDLDHICQSIGWTATRMLEAWYHGRALYVPVAAAPDHPLVLVIGMPALRSLCRDWSGCIIRVPQMTSGERYYRERRVAEMLAEGLPLPQVAEAVNLSVRRIEQLQHELRLRGWLEFADWKGAGGRTRRVSVRTPPRLAVAVDAAPSEGR